MIPTRSLVLLALVVAASLGSVAAQAVRRDRIPRPRDPQSFYAPRNKLEEFEGRLETMLVTGRTYVATLRATGGGVARVEAIEIRDMSNSTRATGVVVTIAVNSPSGPDREIRSLIDYEEIDPLIKAFDTVVKADDNITKLTHFEVRYRTLGDFEVLVFKQVAGGIASGIEGGFFERTRLLLTLDELTRLRWMIAQAKERIDEIK